VTSLGALALYSAGGAKMIEKLNRRRTRSMPQVKQVNHDAIFEKATGHPPEPPKNIVICRGPDKKFIAGNIGNYEPKDRVKG
jgi:hypothetical protein